MFHNALEHWLSKNRRTFRSHTHGLVWSKLYAAFSGNGGRMNQGFREAVFECGYEVKSIRGGGAILARRKTK